MSYFVYSNGIRLSDNASSDRKATYVSDSASDVIRAGSFNDVMKGNGGNDRLFGGAGDDRLAGGQGHDLLNGGTGDDWLDGGVGNDILVGGSGADTFRFSTALNGRTNVDMIRDFKASEGDKIFLDTRFFKHLDGDTSPDTDFGNWHEMTIKASNFTIGKEATAADRRIIYDPTNGHLSYDADGVGGASAVLFARLHPGTSLTASDFYTLVA